MGILAIARIADNRNNIIGLRLLNTEAGKCYIVKGIKP